MNYHLKFKITNNDHEIDSDLAEQRSFEECFHCDGCATPEEAEEKGFAKMRKRYPKFKIECLDCGEHPLKRKEGGGNAYDPADMKKQDTTEHARETKDSVGKSHDQR